MENYYLEILSEENSEKWEEFNEKSPEGSFYHSLKWKQIVDKISKKEAQYFLLFKRSSVVGILPFVDNNIHLFQGLVPASIPQRLHAILAEFDDPAPMQYIIPELKKRSWDSKKSSYICISTLHENTFDGLTAYPLFPWAEDGDMVLDLSEFPPEQIWTSFSSNRGQRKKIRRFDEHGFKLIEVDSLEGLKNFYKYYNENLIHIGARPRPFSHFADLLNILPSDDMRITMLVKNSIVAGGFLMFPYKPRSTVYSTYVSLNRNLPTTYHPSYYLYWEAINWAWENNYKKLSFGAQHLDENNPRYRIKKEFGAQFRPIHSKMISLNKLFTMNLKLKNGVTRGAKRHIKKFIKKH